VKIFDRTSVGNVQLKNRVFFAPMGSATEDTDGGFTQKSIDYYAARAKGGCSMVMVSATVTKEFEGRLLYSLDDVSYANRFERFTEEMHSYDCRVCVQLLAGFGRVGGVQPGTFVPTSASAVPYYWNPDITCRELTRDEIHRIVVAYGKAAKLAKDYGADCVEIHGYGGYLIDQFMTSLWNRRTDEYGGSLENRMRFPRELMDAVRETCGKDFPILFKMTPIHYTPGGRELPEGLEIARWLEEYGVAAVQVDVGCYDSLELTIPTTYSSDNKDLEAARRVKQELSIPVIVSGQLDDPDEVERVLGADDVDYVSIGRGLLADPYWVTKVQLGLVDDITRCIRCNECVLRVANGTRIGCSVNPHAGKETESRIPSTTVQRRVLVVGGGPGGCEAALTAKREGHDVVLWERDDRVGGTLLAAGGPKFKKPIRQLISSQSRQLAELGVPVVTGKTATAEDIVAYDADLTIIATGSHAFVPRVPGIESKQVVSATDLLKGRADVGETCIVIGAGLVGLETALHLTGQGRNVTVVEIQPRILNEQLESHNEAALRKLISESPVEILTGTTLRNVEPGSVVVERDGESLRLPCDSVVLAAGFVKNDGLAAEVSGRVRDLVTVGDANGPRKIMDAVWEGYNAIRALNTRIADLAAV